jgi:hypothetical protein
MTEMVEGVSIKKAIRIYPTLFGAFLASVMVGAIFVIVVWLPRVGEAWEQHNALVRDVWCTVALFGVTLNRLWPLRRRTAFWVLLSTFFLLHSLSLFLYTIHVHALLLREWIVLLLAESPIVLFVLPWLTKRLSRLPHG